MVLIPAVLIVETPTAVSVQTPAATPVNALPSPTNSLAVTIPENVALPLDDIVAAVPTLSPLVAVIIPEVLIDCPTMVREPSAADIWSEVPSIRIPIFNYYFFYIYTNPLVPHNHADPPNIL